MADGRQGYEAARFNPLDYPLSLDLPRRAAINAWHEHTPFIKVLIQLLRPKILVQSGLDNGDFYLAICEASSSLGISCYGVDTFKRAADSNGASEDALLNELRASHDPLYGTFSRLLPGPFEDAAAHFSDNSIELLHIDGLQSYEAVCHDWETWRRKVSRSGIVVFQGTDARTGNHGMWRLWKQLKFTYQHFEFLHGLGLGVLVTGPGIPEALNVFLTMAEKNPDPVRKYFFALGSRASFRAQFDVARAAMKELETRLAEAESRVRTRADEFEKRDLALAAQASEIGRIGAISEAREQALSARDGEMRALHEQIEALRIEAAEKITLRATIEAHERSLQTRDAESKALSAQLEQSRAEAADGVKLKATIETHERSLQTRDAEARALNEQLEKLRIEAAKVSELNSTIEALERSVRTRDGEKQTLAEQLQKARAEAAEVDTLNTIIEEQEQTTRAREATMRAQSEELEKLRPAATDAAALAVKFDEQQRLLQARDAEAAAMQALQTQLQKLQAEATEIGRLNAKIEEQNEMLRTLKEQLSKLQAEAADQRSEIARIQAGSGYKLAQWLTAPLRMLGKPAAPVPKEIKSAARK